MIASNVVYGGHIQTDYNLLMVLLRSNGRGVGFFWRTANPNDKKVPVDAPADAPVDAQRDHLAGRGQNPTF